MIVLMTWELPTLTPATPIQVRVQSGIPAVIERDDRSYSSELIDTAVFNRRTDGLLFRTLGQTGLVKCPWRETSATGHSVGHAVTTNPRLRMSHRKLILDALSS